MYAGVAVLLLANTVFTPHFLSAENFRTQAVQVAPVLIVALGMALAIGSEGVDLSVGSVMALSTSLLSLYLGYGPWVALIVAVLGGAVIGLASGSLIAFIGVQPIVATLALMVAGRGIALVLLPQLKDVRDSGLASLGSGDLLGIPYLVLIAAGLALAVGLHRAAHHLRPAAPRDRRQQAGGAAGGAPGTPGTDPCLCLSRVCWPRSPGCWPPPGSRPATRPRSGR